MKKALLLIILLILIATGLYFGASTFQTIEPIRPIVESYVHFVDDLLGIEKAEIKEVSTEEIFVESDNTEEDLTNTTDSQETNNDLEEDTILETEAETVESAEEDTDTPESNLVEVPEYINLSFYENDILNFTYPSVYEVEAISEYSLNISKNGVNVAYLDIFDNPDHLELIDYLKQDFVNDYLNEATSLKLDTETMDVGQKTIYIKDFPGLKTQDVYLIVFTDQIIVVKVFEEKAAVNKFVISTVEER